MFSFLVFIVKSGKIYKLGRVQILKGEFFLLEISYSRALWSSGQRAGQWVQGTCQQVLESKGPSGPCSQADPAGTIYTPSQRMDLKTSVVLRPGRPYEPRLPTLGCDCP